MWEVPFAIYVLQLLFEESVDNRIAGAHAAGC